MQLRRLVIASFLLSVSALACNDDNDDEQFCTFAGCDNGGAITVSTVGDALLPDATMEINLEFDDEAWLITCRPGEDACDRDGPSETPLRLIVWRGTTGVTIEFSPDERSDLPDGYALRVDVDAERVLDEAGVFEYETFAPNGPDCGTICDSAPGLVFELPAPSE